MVRTVGRGLFCFSMLLACGESDERRVRASTHCAPLDSCSITDEECQQAILGLTACVRGEDVPELPPIRTLSREEFAGELAESDDEEAPSSEATESGRAVELAFAELKLIAPRLTLSDGITAQQTSSVAAFYRPEEQDVTIISDAAMDPDEAMNTLAHELAHYLQDRAGQLERTRRTNVSLDESIARRALTEGDAVVTSYHVLAAMRGVAAIYVRWSAAWEAIENSIVRSTEDSESPLLVALTQLPYLIASPTLQLEWERGGRGYVDDVFDAPPVTQVDWVEGELTRTRAQELDCYPPLPPDGYELAAADSLGVAGLFALLGKRGMASLETASEWRQDRLAVYTRGTGDELEVLAAWRIRLESAASAADYEALLESLDLDVTRSDRELLIRASSGQSATLDSLPAETCPTQRQFAAAVQDRDLQASIRTQLDKIH